MTRLSIIALIIITLFQAKLTHAQKIDTILPGKDLLVKQLKPGLKQYMVYVQMPARNKSMNVSLWVRNVERIATGEQAVYRTTQHWYGADTNQYRHIISLNNASDFSPVYHEETVGSKTKAYNWSAKKVTGADTLNANLAKDFNLDLNFPAFNWNLDIETFEMLPLTAGKIFAIPFYDAGTVPPAYVIYKVAGSEVLSLFGNEKVDCWKLVQEGDYRGNKFTQTFWISKKTHEFLKEEDAFNGGYRYKVKLPANAANVVARFK
jgi:hypothetical protein